MLYKSARVYWILYFKDSKEVGHIDVDTFDDFKAVLDTLRSWRFDRGCHIDVDVTFYPSSIFEDTVTILGAI